MHQLLLLVCLSVPFLDTAYFLLVTIDYFHSPVSALWHLVYNQQNFDRCVLHYYMHAISFLRYTRLFSDTHLHPISPVDLLSNILSPTDIDGMLITHADEVTHDSTEAFIVRIFTSQKQRDKSFIKAFTDAPETLFSGFAKIEKTLRALQVRRFSLYPRFHDIVRKELEAAAPDIEELHQPLSPAMKEIQSAIATAVSACMKELRNLTPLVDWTSADLKIENCATAWFDRAVQRQLDQDWHRLKPQAKQLYYE